MRPTRHESHIERQPIVSGQRVGCPPSRAPGTRPDTAECECCGTGYHASEAFAKEQLEPPPKQAPKDGADQHLYVEAQDAAAKAPDTASADAAKREVLKEGSSKSTP